MKAENIFYSSEIIGKKNIKNELNPIRFLIIHMIQIICRYNSKICFIGRVNNNC